METPRTPLTGDEMRSFEMLGVAMTALGQVPKRMQERLRKIPNGWRDYRLIDAKLTNLFGRLCCTVATGHLMTLKKTVEFGRIKINVNPASKIEGYAVAPQDALETIINTAMGHECALCVREGAELKNCPLKKAFSEVCFPEEPHGSGCWYKKHAATRPLNDYFVTE